MMNAGFSIFLIQVDNHFGVAAGALAAVPIGSRLQSRLSPRASRRLFAVVFFLLGARLIIVNLIHIAGT